MVNEVIAGISNALYSEFGYENHMEEIKQDLKEPCFFISSINHQNKRYPGQRYKRDNQFVIQYFPESKTDTRAECYSVAERMDMCLEVIEVDGKTIRGYNMNYEITDEVLHYFVDYNFFVRKMQTTTTMGTMGEGIYVKGR